MHSNVLRTDARNPAPDVLSSMISGALSEPWAPDQARALIEDNARLRERVQELTRQVEWFKKQIFGQKSERRVVLEDAHQLSLGSGLGVLPEGVPPAGSPVAAHTRRQAQKPTAGEDESGLFFDEARVPVEIITVANPEAKGLNADQYEVIGEKVSHRLAQRPGSYVVLKYVRPVIKVKQSGRISSASAPGSVIEGSRADVSFVAGLLVDKFAYHLPLYRQHQRLGASGIEVSRQWLTQLVHAAGGLLEPIHEAQLDSIRDSRVKAMDETPIKAGRAGPGKMKAAYFWPVYGERDELSFLYFPSREGKHVKQALGSSPPPGAVLLTDGYRAYEQYTQALGITHAQCWAHSRRYFIEAQDIEPERSGQALDMIEGLYAVEKHIREQQLTGQDKREYRIEHAKPIATRMFEWIRVQFDTQEFLPTSPFTKALAYVREREAGLRVYLHDPEVAIDTNHLERALRPIPMGRRNWLFCWTEIGAKYVGIVQSLLATCRLHQIDPYEYFIDVLQRVGQHPAAQVAQLTPRLWKQHFAHQPLKSDLQRIKI